MDSSGYALAVMVEDEPKNGTWTTVPSMPTARWNPMVEAVDGKIYVIGGIAGTGDARRTLSGFEVFSVLDNLTKLPDAPFSRQNGETRPSEATSMSSTAAAVPGRGRALLPRSTSTSQPPVAERRFQASGGAERGSAEARPKTGRSSLRVTPQRRR